MLNQSDQPTHSGHFSHLDPPYKQWGYQLRDHLSDVTDSSWVSTRFLSQVVRFYSTNSARGRYYYVFRNSPFNCMHWCSWTWFVAQISTSFSILVPHMCVLYHSFYCIFSRYLPSIWTGLRYLNSCSEPDMGCETTLARASSNCKRQTRPLVREGAPNQQTSNCQTIIKIWSWAPDGCFIPRQTGWLTVGRNITLTWIVQWLRLAPSKGTNSEGVSLLFWGQKQIQFPKCCVFQFLEYQIIWKPSNSEFIYYVSANYRIYSWTVLVSISTTFCIGVFCINI
jgi:hypothetical protein